MHQKVVKVYLTKEQKWVLEKLCSIMGTDQSETLRLGFMDYAKSIGLITAKVQGKI